MAIIIFLFGLAVGSFLNCLIYRLETGQSFLFGRSFCPHCKHQLGFRDLIPVLSFLLLRGRCRYCQKKISWQYPLVELAAGVLFVLVFNLLRSDLGFYFIAISFLVVIFVYDLKHFIIPDEVIYPAIGITLAYDLLRSNLSGRYDLLISALGAAAFFLAIVLISRGKWMGLGDFKLAILMGLILGFPGILVALFFAFFLGAIIGVGLILAKKKTLKSEVPFGPFLVAGTFLALFFGEKLIKSIGI